MPGDLNQELRLGAIPEGLTLTLTDATASVPDNSGWAVQFYRTTAPNKAVAAFPDVRTPRISRFSLPRLLTPDHLLLQGKSNTFEFPCTIDPNVVDGQIGWVKFHPASGLFNSRGPGGNVTITFKIQGTMKHSGGSPVKVDKIGSINVSAADWGFIERPDTTFVSYNWLNEASKTLPIEVPVGTDPGTAVFVFAGDKANDKAIGMNVTQHKDTINTLIDGTLSGTFWAHGEAVGWVFGKVV